MGDVVSADEQLFHHEVTVLTVGQLRAALAGVPDEARVRVHLATEPGGEFADEQVVFGAGVDPDGWFDLESDFPSGEYYRPPPDQP